MAVRWLLSSAPCQSSKVNTYYGLLLFYEIDLDCICSNSLEVSMDMNLSARCALVLFLLAFVDLKIVSATGKPGVCPRRRWGIGICAELCSNDSDCPNDEKCCYNGCGHVCIAPYTGKPGVCPRRRWGIGICAELCSNDSDCPNDEKCCYNGCGHVCIAPTQTSLECALVDDGAWGIVQSYVPMTVTATRMKNAATMDVGMTALHLHSEARSLCPAQGDLHVCRVLLQRWPVPRGTAVFPDMLILRLQ
ncbi:uncharacterized protein LOC115166029 isoform X2 [Salmo trutta]|uniref:uncharacterized protein LOC115166029 isoform X2 n=1 Tax=Salmo trutta TaxID=8032 RepID=UPI0011317D20|nr:uncharacterized protein LOC115166029 isoform X2 [Salmo trutta]